MINNNEFKGIWISPDGDVYETDNIQSHRLVIKELNIENTLMNFSKTYKLKRLTLYQFAICQSRMSKHLHNYQDV